MRLVIHILLYKMIHCIKYIRIFLLYWDPRFGSPNYKFIKEQKTFFTFILHDWARRRIAVVSLIIQWLYSTGEEPTWSFSARKNWGSVLDASAGEFWSNPGSLIGRFANELVHLKWFTLTCRNVYAKEDTWVAVW